MIVDVRKELGADQCHATRRRKVVEDGQTEAGSVGLPSSSRRDVGSAFDRYTPVWRRDGASGRLLGVRRDVHALVSMAQGSVFVCGQ